MTIADRTCDCGCGLSMAGKAARARFATRDCQVSSLRAHGPSGFRYDRDRSDYLRQVSFRTTPEMADCIQEAADTAGLSQGDWLNELLDDTFSLIGGVGQ
jgi:hypothetical protein